MPVAAPPSFLEANLAALGPAAESLARRLRTIEPAAIDLHRAEDGAATGTREGVALASRRRPLEEAERLVAGIDLVEHATIVVMGFGLGHHVAALARRLGRTGLIVVLEPDLPLLRTALERIDHAAALRDANVVIATDPDDRASLARLLQGAEAILGQGVGFLEHPPSRKRLGDAIARFSRAFAEHVVVAKTALVTTLMRASDTMRNHLGNAAAYAGGAGIADLADRAKGFPGIVVSAGPSLHRNVDRLAAPGLRDRCVIIAAQTCLKPLLARGIRPHFVTALDYHEISKRFYEGLDPADVAETTLVVEPKAHPSILASWPGAVRCCGATALDRLLGPLQRPMGEVPSGATVAHLSFHLARFLGCDPIALIGQDLGFPDGLYYAPGTAIHDVWGPELGPFNTIAMLEWQRVVRHRAHLHRLEDVHGRPIWTDAQMLTYLQQFERDFAVAAEEGVTVIDATEGGARKRHCRVATLEEVLAESATRPLPDLPRPPATLDDAAVRRAAARFRTLRHEIVEIRRVSRHTADLMGLMIRDQSDPVRMAKHFEGVEAARSRVEKRFAAFELVNMINQVGVFKRLKADRRLHLAETLPPLERQRAQIERDLENVRWLADAAAELGTMLAEAADAMEGRAVRRRRRTRATVALDAAGGRTAPVRAAAIVAVDPERDGRGRARRLDGPCLGAASVLQATLERLDAAAPGFESIVLLVPEGWDPEPLLDRGRLRSRVEIDVLPDGPFGPRRDAIAAARALAGACWRGGVAGATIFDEAIAPRAMHDALARRGLDAALVAAPDWPLLAARGDGAAAALLARWREQPDLHGFVFTQAPPGASAFVVSRAMLGQLAEGGRLATIGANLVYQPRAPQPDPIARASNVQIEHPVRHARVRATWSTARERRAIEETIAALGRDAAPEALLPRLEEATARTTALPLELRVELTTRRAAIGGYRRRLGPAVPAADLAIARLRRLLETIGPDDDVAISFVGAGDPLLHPDFDEAIALARAAGASGVHLRSELPGDDATIDRLIASAPDVLSIDLHGESDATVAAMLGAPRRAEIVDRMQRLLDARRHLEGPRGAAALALPWIVPRLMRCDETIAEVEPFFDRWMHVLGAATIESPPDPAAESIAPAPDPAAARRRALRERLVVRADGTVPIDERDLRDGATVGSIDDDDLAALWSRLRRARADAGDAAGTLLP